MVIISVLSFDADYYLGGVIFPIYLHPANIVLVLIKIGVVLFVAFLAYKNRFTQHFRNGKQ